MSDHFSDAVERTDTRHSEIAMTLITGTMGEFREDLCLSPGPER